MTAQELPPPPVEPPPVEPPPAEPEPPTAPANRRQAVGCLFELVETVVLTVVIFFGIQTFVAQPFKVEGASMENTLQSGQYVLIDKLSPRWAPYQRGDIVVLNPPTAFTDANGVPFIKRVIGVPGDVIELKNGTVYVNATVLTEPYVFTDGGPKQTNAGPGGLSRWVVPRGDLFVMGDHRNDSEDSRIFGPVAISNIIGRAWLRYWPIDSFGFLAGAS